MVKYAYTMQLISVKARGFKSQMYWTVPWYAETVLIVYLILFHAFEAFVKKKYLQ